MAVVVAWLLLLPAEVKVAVGMMMVLFLVYGQYYIWTNNIFQYRPARRAKIFEVGGMGTLNPFVFLRPRKVIFLGATRSGRKTVARPENRWKGLFDVGRTIEAPFRYSPIAFRDRREHFSSFAKKFVVRPQMKKDPFWYLFI